MPANLSAAIDDAFLYDSKVLIETAINGREIECAVLERDGTSYASVVGEIVVNPQFEFYDFEAKYLDEGPTLATLEICKHSRHPQNSDRC